MSAIMSGFLVILPQNLGGGGGGGGGSPRGGGGGGGGVLPYKGLMGQAASQGMFFGIFVLKRVPILSIFELF